MMMNIAIDVLFLGLTLLLWLCSKKARSTQIMYALSTIVVILVGLLTLSEYMFHLDLRLEQIALSVALGWVWAVVFGRSQDKTVVAQAPARSETLLQQSQKMEAIGRLAGGVAHDFNNLLAVIIGYSDLLLESFASSEPDRQKVEQIKQAAGSAASLTRQLLMFSRQQVVQPVILDINQTVGNTEKMLRRLIKENIEFTVVLDPHVDRVKADPGQIEQIVVNLVVNARDAMPNGGKLRIQTTNVSLEKESLQAEVGLPRGRFILLEVTDTGTGMDQQTQSRIFEPFFTTKTVGKGTGLGLATVYGIVKQCNGYIEVQSTLGHGSSFKIYLPAAEQAEANHESRNSSAETAFSGETVLVVEDAEPLRGLVCEVLIASGCSVLFARDGREASRIVSERKGAIDLLLTDVIMPGMSGPALAKQVRSLRPQTKILYMSGYSGEFLPDMLAPGVSFIQKPFTLADLSRKIRKMLADKPKETSGSAAAASQQTGTARKATSARASG
jgi:two-component system cell cycle sensor histidine kinase/response regulator CckA